MTRSMIMPLLFGAVGCAILLGLGKWQLDRLNWKRQVIGEIETQMKASSVPLPAAVKMGLSQYLPVETEGQLSGREIHVLASVKFKGPGYRVISRLESDHGPVLVDLGFVPEEEKDLERIGRVKVTGNILDPDDVNSYTPEPNLERNIWFARDLAAMAEHLETEPLLVVAARVDPLEGLSNAPVPLPVTANIKNDHLEYAITWFSLAFVWFVMTGYWLWRIRRKNA